MIIYGGNADVVGGYKAPSNISFDFIHSRRVAVKRPAGFLLRELTSERKKFLENIGLKLKKK